MTETASEGDAPALPLEAEAWTKEDCVARLGDPEQSRFAAIRLVHLSGAEVLCVPEGLTRRTLDQVVVLQLGDDLWALGFSVQGEPRRLRAPTLITRAGDVIQPLSGLDEELAFLLISPDADVFPHLIVSPTRIVQANDPSILMLKLKSGDARFTDRSENGFTFLALVHGAGPEAIEVARYKWDPYELAFVGPARDALPDPPGGVFEIDLLESPALLPRGGLIEQPEPVPNPPQAPDPDRLRSLDHEFSDPA